MELLDRPAQHLSQPTLSGPQHVELLPHPFQCTNEQGWGREITPLSEFIPWLHCCPIQWLVLHLCFLWPKEGFGRPHSSFCWGSPHWRLNLQGTGHSFPLCLWTGGLLSHNQPRKQPGTPSNDPCRLVPGHKTVPACKSNHVGEISASATLLPLRSCNRREPNSSNYCWGTPHTHCLILALGALSVPQSKHSNLWLILKCL